LSSPQIDCHDVHTVAGDDTVNAMTKTLTAKLVERIAKIDPPGSCGTYVHAPIPTTPRAKAIPINFVMEHRFAFFYWNQCKQRLMDGQEDRYFTPPDLVTWDWHDDTGATADVNESELSQLDQTNDADMMLYAMAGLHILNDGQVRPAMWLNMIGNVYVLQKQKRNCANLNSYEDNRFGKSYRIHYVNTPAKLAELIADTRSQSGLIWDIDLDFFTVRGKQAIDQRYHRPMSRRDIQEMLSPRNDWMQEILAGVKAITIALEPDYTGGLSRSLELYSAWEEALFDSPVFNKRTRWRRDI
jgi:hypothetical protein